MYFISYILFTPNLFFNLKIRKQNLYLLYPYRILAESELSNYAFGGGDTLGYTMGSAEHLRTARESRLLAYAGLLLRLLARASARAH